MHERLRRFLATLHRYVGLALLLQVGLAALTGGLLVFAPELDRLLNPALLQVKPAAENTPRRSFAEQLQAAAQSQAAQDDGLWQVVSIVTPLAAEEVGVVWFRRPDPEREGKSLWRQVLLNPYDASVLGQRDRSHAEFSRAGLMRAVGEFHGSLLLGESGRWVMGVSALLWALTSLLGLYLWWPGLAKLRQALSVNRSAGSVRFHFDLHRAAGVYCAPFLLLAAVTGIYMALPTEFRQVISSIAPVEAGSSPRVPAPVDAMRLSADQVVSIAQQVFPGSQLTRIGLPRKGGDAYSVNFLQASESPGSGIGRSVVWVDPYRGAVLQAVNPLKDIPGGDRFLNWLPPLHTGVAFGLLGRVLVMIAGLAALTLVVTGFSVWRRKASSFL